VDISIIIPAHNEELFLPKCLAAVKRAAAFAQIEVELIVVLNRCTDGTEEIARAAGAIIAREEDRNLSKIRNAGATLATGNILVTCDADSVPHERIFTEVMAKLASGKLVGGGTLTLPERWSVGVVASLASVMPYLIWHGVSFGLFWCRTEDFRAIGGFNEKLLSIEDLDFAKRLRKHGQLDGRSLCRKFDQFGDWYLFRSPRLVWRVFQGTDREVSDRFWYKVGR